MPCEDTILAPVLVSIASLTLVSTMAMTLVSAMSSGSPLSALPFQCRAYTSLQRTASLVAAVPVGDPQAPHQRPCYHLDHLYRLHE
jgi:hypothetical protein